MVRALRMKGKTWLVKSYLPGPFGGKIAETIIHERGEEAREL